MNKLTRQLLDSVEEAVESVVVHGDKKRKAGGGVSWVTVHPLEHCERAMKHLEQAWAQDQKGGYLTRAGRLMIGPVAEDESGLLHLEHALVRLMMAVAMWRAVYAFGLDGIPSSVGDGLDAIKTQEYKFELDLVSELKRYG